jgi:dihydrofolate reductase
MKVTLLMALTLDGKIGKSPNHYPDWTGKEDKKLFVEISKRAGVVIMGSKTFDTFGKPLPDRKNIILTRKKNRISEWENLIYTDKKPPDILQDLEKEGFSNAVLAGGATINSLFAKEKLIDEIIVTISPKIFGYGISLFSDQTSMELELKEVERVGTDLVCLKYKVVT